MCLYIIKNKALLPFSPDQAPLSELVRPWLEVYPMPVCFDRELGSSRGVTGVCRRLPLSYKLSC
jgi:hypothetical protein